MSIGRLRALSPLGIEIPQNPFDAILTFDAFVEEELQLGDAPQPHPPAELPSQEWSRALERALGIATRLVVTERRVVDAGLLQVRRDFHVRHGEEPDPRIVHLAREEV
jgi:hypothetical protein